MPESVIFKGFAGHQLAAAALGKADAPAVLLLDGGDIAAGPWAPVAAALAAAGRRVVSLALRESDGAADTDSLVGSLRLVLAQIGSRPIVVASARDAAVAAAALVEDGPTLAAGLVLADPPGAATEQGPAPEANEAFAALTLPVLVLRDPGGAPSVPPGLAAALPDCEQFETADDETDAFNAALLDFLERRQPRAALEFRSGTDARTLRDALGCFATGITIVTAIGADGTPVGLTANSFTSVSLDPPLLLVCIANGASSASVLREATHFAVNVLQIGQQPTSNRFASKGEDRFAGIDWLPGEHGAPVLAGSLGAFECARHAVHEGGDHFILIGRVTKATFEPRRDPLLYFRGKYRRLHFA